MSSYGRVVVVSENRADCLLSKVLFPLFRGFWVFYFLLIWVVIFLSSSFNWRSREYLWLLLVIVSFYGWQFGEFYLVVGCAARYYGHSYVLRYAGSMFLCCKGLLNGYSSSFT